MRKQKCMSCRDNKAQRWFRRQYQSEVASPLLDHIGYRCTRCSSNLLLQQILRTECVHRKNIFAAADCFVDRTLNGCSSLAAATHCKKRRGCSECIVAVQYSETQRCAELKACCRRLGCAMVGTQSAALSRSCGCTAAQLSEQSFRCQGRSKCLLSAVPSSSAS